MSKRILENYQNAKNVYKELGVDTDKVIEQLRKIPVSLHCWAGDDIVGFEGLGDVASQNVVTGSYPYRATNGEELRSDIDKAFYFSPLKHKVNLHSMYAERQNPRNDLNVEDFRNWIDWAKEKGYGLDFNASFFTHPMMDGDFSAASPKKEVRDYWIQSGINSRKIAVAIGKELNQKCWNNFWFPDGLKDVPANRLKYRQLLTESLDEMMKEPYSTEDQKYACDVLEGKLFGIGTEAFVVGSHDFYYGYALTRNCGITMDTGHYHPNESVADKVSAIAPFVSNLMLHVSRGIGWDSDHTVIQDDHLFDLMRELKRGNWFDKVAIGLDFFDASINRIAGWAIGLRATAKAILTALLEPTHLLEKAEDEGDFTQRLFLMEEFKNLPINAVWEYVLHQNNIPVSLSAISDIKNYEKNILSKNRK